MVHNYFFHQQKGAAALLLTIILLAGLLIAGLAVAMVMLSEMKLSRGTSDSVVAYFVADAAAEKALYNVRSNFWTVTLEDTGSLAEWPLNSSFYELDVDLPGDGSAEISVRGYYLNSVRVIEVGW